MNLWKKKPKTASGIYYPLNRVPANGCGSFGIAKGLAHFSDSIGESQIRFLKENNIYSITNKLPYYKDYNKSNDIYKLVYLQKIEYRHSKSCSNLDLRNIEGLSKAAVIFDHDVKGFSITTLVLTLITLIFVFLWVLRKKKKIL